VYSLWARGNVARIQSGLPDPPLPDVFCLQARAVDKRGPVERGRLLPSYKGVGMSAHVVTMYKDEDRIVPWHVRIDWPYGPYNLCQTRWGAVRWAKKALKNMETPGRSEKTQEVYIVEDEGRSA
jgi:hypothetical protein